MKSPKQLNSVKVFIRNRPFLGSEIGGPACVNILNDKQLIITSHHSKQNEQKQKHAFTFDKVFPPEASQQEVYDEVSENIVANIFQGINGTIFCYGQTSSGKTYTCLGNNIFGCDERGLLPRIIQDILNKIEISPKHLQCKMTMSIVQIYNQKIRDLLDNSKHDLKIRQNKSQGIFINNVTEKYILTPEDSNKYILKGIQNRAVGSTNMNLFSSRSHMMITLTVHQHNLYTGQAKAAKLILVDLAGCEKISRSGTHGKLLQEAKKINTSLSVLGKVIKILSHGKNSHIPYRDSKLTRLLQESLGGNCITNLIINISPAAINQNETILSLRFGSRAKSIKNKPQVNKQYTVNELLDLLSKAQKKIKEQTEIIADLLKNNGNSSNLDSRKFDNFLKNYQQDRQREKQEEEFRSELGSDDGMKKIKNCLSSSLNHYQFCDLSEFQEEQYETKEQIGFEKPSFLCFGKQGLKQTNSVAKLFSTHSEFTPKLKKSDSLLGANKSYEGHDILKKNARSNSNCDKEVYDINLISNKLKNLKEKPVQLPLVIPSFVQLSQTNSENQELESEAKEKGDSSKDEIRICNISGKSSYRSSKNGSSNGVNKQQKTRTELDALDLSLCQKIFDISINSKKQNRSNSDPISLKSREKICNKKTNHEIISLKNNDIQQKVIQKQQNHLAKELNLPIDRKYNPALQNLRIIKMNMRRIAALKQSEIVTC